MERLTKRLEDGQAIFHECHGTCGTCDGANCYCIGPMVDRLSAYEDTGLEPEEIEDSIGWMSPVCVQCDGKTSDGIRTEKCGYTDNITKCLEQSKHLAELAQAEQDGRLVVLDEPMRPLVWGDKEHDTILCPRCLCDLMGGFEYAPSCETVMFQCPHCGQPINSGKAIDMEQSEAEATMKGGEG